MRSWLPLVLFIGLLGVSFGAPLARFLPEMPALSIAFWRMCIASMVLWGITLVKTPISRSPAPQKLIIPAGIFLAGHFATFYGALKYASVANVTLIVALAPAFMLLLERFYLRRIFSRQLVAGLCIALVGALVVHGYRLDRSDSITLGTLMALASALCWAGVLIIAERVRQDSDTVAYTRWLYLVAAISLGAVVLISGQSILFDRQELPWLLALGIVPTLIGHNSLNYAVKFLRPTVVGAVPIGEPVLASLLAWLFFREGVSVQVLIGGAIILGGLLVIAMRPMRTRA